MVLLYQIIDSSRYEEAIAFTYEQFLLQGPLGKVLFDTVPERNTALDILLLTCLESNLSWCAIDEQHGHIVAILLSSSVDLYSLPDIQKTYNDYITDGMTPQLASIFGLWNEIFDMKQFLIDQKQTQLFYMQIGCVRNDYINTTIGTEVFKRSLIHASTVLGYPLITTISTSYYTQTVLEKTGFRKLKEVKYANCIVNGKTVFKNVEKPHQSAICYYKVISVKCSSSL